MKTRLPKLFLAALLAAMTTAYAYPSYVTVNGNNQYYAGGTSGDPFVITNADGFGADLAGAPERCTVNIGYGDNVGNAYDAYFTLLGDDFTTTNNLFIGGPGWPHTLTEGYEPSKGVLTIDDGATLTSTNILLGTCAGAESYFYIQGGSSVHAANLQVSNGGGLAQVTVGANDSEGHLHLDGNLSIGVNNVTGQELGWDWRLRWDWRLAPAEAMGNKMEVRGGSTVDVAGTTSVGYATETYCGAEGMLFIHPDAVVNTDSLEMGIGMMTGVLRSKGLVAVSGTLNVTGSEHETLIGVNGGYGILRVCEGGIVNLGKADVRVGSTNMFGGTTNAELIVDERGTLTHNGTIYVGDKGTESKEGDEKFGIGSLYIEQGGVARLNEVEVSEGSEIYVDGKLTVDETPDAYGIKGVRLYRGAILGGTPDNQGGLLSFSVVPENNLRTDIVIDNFTLTSGTTLKTCCDNHFIVDSRSSLTFSDGTMWLTDGIVYIDGGEVGAGVITTENGTGNISVRDNQELEGWLEVMGRERTGSQDKVALIDAYDFVSEGGDYSGVLADGTLKLENSAFEVRFSDTDVTTLNEGEFTGFYVVKVGDPSDDAVPYLDRNETETYNIIKMLEKDGFPIPDDLREIIEGVLNIDGKKDPGKVATALDFLGSVNYAVMMHNQIEGNLSHQRMLRNRSMAGRNLRHGKGCTDLYAAGFYNNQRLKYKFSHGEGYRRSEWGGMIGGDTCINENLRLGADIALGWSNISPTHNMKLKQRSLYWDVYAQFRKGNWRSLTSLGMGIHNFKVKRSLGDLYAGKNNVRGLSLNISEEVTYDWKINEKTTIQPFAAVDLNWNRINSFTDGDIGGANMHVDRQTAFMAEFTLGGRYIREFACVTDAPDATWYFQLGVAVAAGQLDSDMHCYFVGAPDYPFTIQAEERDRVGLDLGTGITIPVAQHWSVYGSAEVIFRGDSHHLNAQLGVQYAF